MLEPIEIPQVREIRTAIPGPRSLELAAVEEGVRARRCGSHDACLRGACLWRHRRRRRWQLVHRPRRWDRGLERRVKRPLGRPGRQRAGAALHAHVLPSDRVRRLHRAGGAPQRPRPGRPRETKPLCQLRSRGGRERRQDRPLLHRPPGRRGVRPRFPRTDSAHDVAHGKSHAVQVGFRPVRAGDLPRAVQLSLPLCRRRAARGLWGGMRGPGHRLDGQADRR